MRVPINNLVPQKSYIDLEKGEVVLTYIDGVPEGAWGEGLANYPYIQDPMTYYGAVTASVRLPIDSFVDNRVWPEGTGPTYSEPEPEPEPEPESEPESEPELPDVPQP